MKSITRTRARTKSRFLMILNRDSRDQTHAKCTYAIIEPLTGSTRINRIFNVSIWDGRVTNLRIYLARKSKLGRKISSKMNMPTQNQDRKSSRRGTSEEQIETKVDACSKRPQLMGACSRIHHLENLQMKKTQQPLKRASNEIARPERKPKKIKGLCLPSIAHQRNEYSRQLRTPM